MFVFCNLFVKTMSFLLVILCMETILRCGATIILCNYLYLCCHIVLHLYIASAVHVPGWTWAPTSHLSDLKGLLCIACSETFSFRQHHQEVSRSGRNARFLLSHSTFFCLLSVSVYFLNNNHEPWPFWALHIQLVSHLLCSNLPVAVVARTFKVISISPPSFLRSLSFPFPLVVEQAERHRLPSPNHLLSSCFECRCPHSQWHQRGHQRWDWTSEELPEFWGHYWEIQRGHLLLWKGTKNGRTL